MHNDCTQQEQRLWDRIAELANVLQEHELRISKLERGNKGLPENAEVVKPEVFWSDDQQEDS